MYRVTVFLAFFFESLGNLIGDFLSRRFNQFNNVFKEFNLVLSVKFEPSMISKDLKYFLPTFEWMNMIFSFESRRSKFAYIMK